MNLIDRIAELRRLEGRLQAIYERQKDPRSPNYAILERFEIQWKLQDAAPDLLDILSEIRPGDAQTISEIIDSFTFMGDPIGGIYADCLRRYQSIAAKMEVEE